MFLPLLSICPSSLRRRCLVHRRDSILLQDILRLRKLLSAVLLLSLYVSLNLLVRDKLFNFRSHVMLWLIRRGARYLNRLIVMLAPCKTFLTDLA